MINTITLMGRLTATPELKTTQNGKSVTSFSVAVERDFKDDDGNRITDFINIVSWGKQAEFVCNYFGKGDMIALTGRLETRRYEDKQGNKRTAFEVIANNLSFCGARNETSSRNSVDIEDDDDEEMPF